VALISVGGLATGLDTNSIIEQLIQLERRPIVLLERERDGVKATQNSIASVRTRLAALKTALDGLDTAGKVLVRKASSSDETVLGAVAGAGAARGAATFTVGQLARPSIAGSSTGVASGDALVAPGDGTFEFQVGSGEVQTVALTGATTLQGLATAINDLRAGVTASAVNLGTTASPDYRLLVTSDSTGVSSNLTIVNDGTTIGVSTTQTALNAQLALSGFTGTFERETNTFSDVLPFVTLTLKNTGTSTVAVNDDTDAIVEQMKKLVAAYNDVVTFVREESDVTQDADTGDVTIDSLAGDSMVRRLVDSLQDQFSGVVSGIPGGFVNLASLGFKTTIDGTLQLDESKLRAALAEDAIAVAEVLAGAGAIQGVAGRASDLIEQATGAGGALDVRKAALDSEVRRLDDDIAAGERRVLLFEEDLRRQFAALESLVSSLQSQGAFLSQALGG